MAQTKQNLSQSFSQMVKLHEADEPWKPSFKQKISSNLDQALLVEENIKRNVLSVLNKITPQKYDILLRQLKMLDIDTENKLDIIINLMYERAAYEPLYSVIYAKMYKDIVLDKKTIEVKEDKIEKKIEFCHQFGNMKFVGELFKQNMISEAFLHYFIQHLFSLSDEKSLSCLCQLLKTVGKEVDKKTDFNSRKSMEFYFLQMQEIIDKRSTSTRIRFMLQDVIDLKKNNWVPRRIENYPKTIDEIHMEVAMEQEKSLDICKKRGKKSESPSKCTELSEEELKQKSKHFIEVFLNNNNFELVNKSVTESFSSSTINIFIKVALDLVPEQSSEARNLVGQLLFSLVKQKFITMEQFQEGLSCSLEVRKETEEDKSFSLNHIAEILQPMLADETYSLRILKDLLSSCIPSKTAGRIISIILHNLANEKGNLTVKERWEQSKLNWSDILGDGVDVDEFICQHKLEFISDYSSNIVPAEVSKTKDGCIKKHGFGITMQTVNNNTSPNISNQNASSTKEECLVFYQVLAQQFDQATELSALHPHILARQLKIIMRMRDVHKLSKTQLDKLTDKIQLQQTALEEILSRNKSNPQSQQEALRRGTQSAQQMPFNIHTQQSRRTKKVLKLIDPKTGKNILEDLKAVGTKHAPGATMQTVNNTTSPFINKQNTSPQEAYQGFHQVPCQHYHQVPNQHYPPQIPCQHYPPQVPCQHYPPQISCQHYPPQVPCQHYPPQVPCQHYLPQVPCQHYPPQVPCQHYPPQVPCQHYHQQVPCQHYHDQTAEFSNLHPSIFDQQIRPNYTTMRANANQNSRPAPVQTIVGKAQVLNVTGSQAKQKKKKAKSKKKEVESKESGKANDLLQNEVGNINESATLQSHIQTDAEAANDVHSSNQEICIKKKKNRRGKRKKNAIEAPTVIASPSPCAPTDNHQSPSITLSKDPCQTVNSVKRIQYGRDCLLQLQTHPLSTALPSYLELLSGKKMCLLRDQSILNFFPMKKKKNKAAKEKKNVEINETGKTKDLLINEEIIEEVSTTIASTLSCAPVDSHQSTSVALSKTVNIARTIQYGRDVLMKLRTHPLSTVLPSYLVNSFILLEEKTCPTCFKDFTSQASLESDAKKCKKRQKKIPVRKYEKWDWK